MPDTFSIGMDLGGTNARAAAIAPDGTVLSLHKEKLRDRTPEGAVEALGHCAESAVQSAGLPAEACTGIGVGIAGQIEGQTGKVLVAPNLGWRDVDIGGLLTARLGRPVAVANDLAVAALGEARAGAARGHSDAILVFVGSGVGSGLILGGKIHRGARGVAGEFGHTKVRPGGRRCGCGEVGCLEAYAGGHNLASRAIEEIRGGRKSSLGELLSEDSAQITAGAVEQAAEQGDELARELREEAGDLLGIAVANLVTLLNPAVLILGGGVLTGSSHLRRKVEDEVRRHAGRAALEGLMIVDPQLGDDAGVIGAGFLGS